MGQQDRAGRDLYPFSGNIGYGQLAPEDSHYQEQQPSKRDGAPLPILHALREHCRIPGDQYFVVAFDRETSAPRIFTSPHNWPDNVIQEFFDSEQFVKCCLRSSVYATTPNYEDQRIPYRRQGFETDALEEHDRIKPARKRFRASESRLDTNFGEDDIPSPVITKKTSISVNDEDQLRKFYEQRFKNCQQSACKLIAKAWIKAVEPKKQSTHPYTGKDEKAPDWWPKGKEEKVRHKEPDHLLKRERLYLLCHILGMIVKPIEQQHRDIRKLQLNVTKLREVTNEALSSWFADSTNPGNRQKKPYLDEIFRVAREQERYYAGELDPSAKVHVKSEERIAEGYASDNEDSSPSRIGDEPDFKPISRSLTPAKGPIPNMMAYATSGQTSLEHGENHMHGSGYAGNVSMRDTHYNQQVMSSELHGDQPHYGGVGSMSVAPHLQPPQDFNTPTTPTAYAWATTSAPSNPSNPPMYSVPQGQPALHDHFAPQNPGLTSQTYMGISYSEGLSAHRNQDLGAPNMFRGGTGPAHIHHQPGYGDYYQGSRVLPGSGIKQEGLSRHLP